MATNFGIREVCDVTLEPLAGGNPIFINTAKMSSLETASTTVYAQGGKGNSRLRAWEGEKTVTFTVEDALITREQLIALTGATVISNTMYVKTTSFAGEYKITANTLARGDDGNDYAMTITIPKAKLQSTLNLSMSPTGDPSSFTFTFDAFPATLDGETNVLFAMDVSETPWSEEDDGKVTRVTLHYTTGTGAEGQQETLSVSIDDIALLMSSTDNSHVVIKSDNNIIATGTVSMSIPGGELYFCNSQEDVVESKGDWTRALFPGKSYEFWVTYNK